MVTAFSVFPSATAAKGELGKTPTIKDIDRMIRMSAFNFFNLTSPFFIGYANRNIRDLIITSEATRNNSNS
ncbi:hypothetical protein D3C81_1107230 [compost metagenome]